MVQGRQALLNLLNNIVDWPPVVVPFGIDPFGWHGKQESYKDICEFALENCTLLPKVFPVSSPLLLEKDGNIRIHTEVRNSDKNIIVKFHQLIGSGNSLTMETIQTPEDTSWKVRKRWIENDDDLDIFLSLPEMAPEEPDISIIREKEIQVGEYGLPYVEITDPFALIGEMLPTDMFYIKLYTDSIKILKLLSWAEERIISIIEKLCRNTGCPFILRLIGAEMAVPPFLSRADFIRLEGSFYKKISEIIHCYGIPAAIHCHGPVSDIMDDIWDMGFSFIEPFEPPPNGNIGIAEALARSKGKGIVFGGIDEILLNTGSSASIEKTVRGCLDAARGIETPYILSQTATPFYNPIPEKTMRNYLSFMNIGANGK